MHFVNGIKVRDDFKDLTGKRFGRLIVIKLIGRKNGKHIWLCECDCGKEKLITKYDLESGATKSCGCLQKERTIAYHTKHGLSENCPEYKIWSAIKDRCFNKKCKHFYNYGGRGITVCDRYKNSFEEFINNLGFRISKNYTIGRINNDGHYSCGKCEECIKNGWIANLRWETRTQQNRNHRGNKHITFDGQTKILIEWAEEMGINFDTLWNRIYRYGWSVEEALITPVKFGQKMKTIRKS